ncbi:MAG: hypothetical protein Q8M26_08875 [Pseudolabrys sp.]|nr:hypothetical protein [Pseudolabrys sp.]
MKLNPQELKVLRFLVRKWSEYGEFTYCSFAPIMCGTKLTRPDVRRACRSLKRKGLASFKAGLWTEDGEPYGSGYSCTKAGADFDPPKIAKRKALPWQDGVAA